MAPAVGSQSRGAKTGGVTYPDFNVVDYGPSGYSQLVEVSSGNYGIVWEHGAVLPFGTISFGAFDLTWATPTAPASRLRGNAALRGNIRIY